MAGGRLTKNRRTLIVPLAVFSTGRVASPSRPPHDVGMRQAGALVSLTHVSRAHGPITRTARTTCNL